MVAGRILVLAWISMILLLMDCTEEQPYAPQAIPGKIVGIIKPEHVIAQVKLYQGTLIQTVFSDSFGFFELENVLAGIYNLEFLADHFGRQVLSGVVVSAGQVTTTPDILLLPYPEQISNFIPVSDEQNFPLTAPIQIQFSVLMNHQSVENSFNLTPPVSGRFSWEIVAGTSKLSFYPEDQYVSNYDYALKLTAGARTSAGIPLSFDFESRFKTEGVKVTATIPEHQATFVSPQTGIYLNFNSRMDRQSVEQSFGLMPAKMGDFKWFDARRVCFQPGSYLASSTVYTVTMSETARDSYNNLLERETVVTFETEPLRILSNYPANGATSVSRSGPITITFNTMVNQAAAQQAFSLTPAVEGWDFQWSDLTRFQFSGASKLQPNTFYSVKIDTICSDAWGNFLPSDFEFIFRTGN